jgi:hypothetical protein
LRSKFVAEEQIEWQNIAVDVMAEELPCELDWTSVQVLLALNTLIRGRWITIICIICSFITLVFVV